MNRLSSPATTFKEIMGHVSQLAAELPMSTSPSTPCERRTETRRSCYRGPLHELHENMRLYLAQLNIIADGVHLVLERAERAGDYNAVAASVLCRTLSEYASYVEWLMIPAIGAHERTLRFLAWRADELDSARCALLEIGQQHTAAELVITEERRLLEMATRCQIVTARSASGSLMIERSAGDVVRVPDKTARVGALHGTKAYYKIASLAAHSSFHSIRGNMKAVGKPSRGLVDAEVTSVGVSFELLLGVAPWALARPALLLADYNGVPADQLRGDLVVAEYRAGMVSDQVMRTALGTLSDYRP